MKKYMLFGIFLIVIIPIKSLGQGKFQNTITYDAGKGSPKADLSAIKWIEGSWRGQAFGGVTEEVWTPPLGGSMMCVFKLVINNKVQFYEIVTIAEEEETLILRLKHFHIDLKGWEKKDETVDFKLVKVTEDKVYFDEFTFEKVSDDEINIYVIIDDKGKQEEIKFNYKKVKS
ncbi:hypothetical protein GTQ40_07340 [Flavobacteriaceae bacterium R38]|nr:hypothetical protein [Flavobacteriaceae bacterium R38]